MQIQCEKNAEKANRGLHNGSTCRNANIYETNTITNVKCKQYKYKEAHIYTFTVLTLLSKAHLSSYPHIEL